MDFLPFQINNIYLNSLSFNSLLLNRKDSKFWLLLLWVSGKAKRSPRGVIFDNDSIIPHKPVGKGEFSTSFSHPFLKINNNT